MKNDILKTLYSEIEQELKKYISTYGHEPTSIIIHPDHHAYFIENLKQIIYRFNPEVGKLMKYKGISIFRSEDVKFGEIKM